LQNRSLHDETLRASGAVSKCRGVGYDGAQATVQGQKVLGVSVTDAAAGALFAATCIGTAIIESGAVIAKGDALIVDALGRAIPASPLGVVAGAVAMTSSAANGAVLSGATLPDFVFADALEAADVSGRFIEIKLR